jgi:hypothetical protein
MNSTVIQRLRASDRQERERLFTHGREDGQLWAQEAAEASELRRLASGLDVVGYDGSAIVKFCECLKDDWDKDDVASIIRHPHEYVSDHHGDEFFSDVLCGGCSYLADEPAYVHGFAAGALEVWSQVADKL